MAGLRLSARALLALACLGAPAARAEAPPGAAPGTEVAAASAPPAPALPPDWTALPGVAAALRAGAAGPAVVVDLAEAWGDPARGCYATRLAVHGGGGTPDDLAAQLRAALGDDGARDARRPTPGLVELPIARAGLRGRLRVALGRGPVDGAATARAVACVASARAPSRCARQCDALLGALR